MTVALTGFMGCGKSSVASCLASLMECPFFDLDDIVRVGEGASVSEIFRNRGEQEFRRLEYEYLERFFALHGGEDSDSVLALGGGTIINPECATLIKENTLCVYLKASVDELVKNLEIAGTSGRPLLAGASDLHGAVSSLLEKRSPIYESCADAVVGTGGLSSMEVARRIYDFVKTGLK